MKVGVFFCTCAKTSSINYKDIKKDIKDIGEVRAIEIHDKLCQDNGLAYIIEDIRRKKLDKILIGCTSKKQVFEEVTTDMGLRSDSVIFLNLREHCGWVHDKKDATEKANRLVRAAIHQIKTKPAIESFVVDVGHDILVVGKAPVGMDVAKDLSRFAHVHYLTESQTAPALCPPGDVDVRIGPIKGLHGTLGNFSVEIIKNPIDQTRCIACGLCEQKCPTNAIVLGTSYSINTDLCDKCGACVGVCPTKAITMDEQLETIKVGQIIALDSDWKHPTQAGIHLCAADAASDECGCVRSALLDVIANLGKIKKQRFLDVNLENCAAAKSELIGCNLCENACQHGAITRNGDAIAFNEIACQGCGICSAICPISLTQLREYPDNMIYSQMEILLGKIKREITPTVLMFACSDCGLAVLEITGKNKPIYPAVMPLFVPCVGSISEAHILRAFDLGADGAIILGCKDCQSCNGDLPSVRFSNMALNAFGLGERVSAIRYNADEAEAFTKFVTDFVGRLTPAPLKGTPAKLDKTTKRDVLLALIQSLSTKTGALPSIIEKDTKYPFAELVDASKCTLCDTCVSMCPMNAIIKTENTLNFVYGYCIACGLCEKACPEDTLHLEHVLDFAKLASIEETTVATSEVVNCARCGKAFLTKAALDKISDILREAGGGGEFTMEEQIELLEYCEDCRGAKALEKLLKKTGEVIN